MTPQARLTLTWLGMLALGALGIALWQREQPPTTSEAAQLRGASWDEALAAARQVDLNASDAVELERLPEIGPSLAQRIVEERQAHGPFRSLAELSRVKGIGPKTLEALSPYVQTD